MSNRDLLESALKRVNAFGFKGKLYKDNTGWYVAWYSIFGGKRFDESARSASELLAYLHGIEDAFIFINNN